MKKQLPLLMILMLCLGILPTFAQQAVTSFTLVNADTDKPIRTLVNGDVINYSTLGTKNISIVANTNPATVGSVVFVLDGKNKTENIAPYTCAGDNATSTSVNYNPIYPALIGGSHSITATPYSSYSGSGTKGTSYTVGFSVVDSTTGGNIAPKANAGVDKTITLPSNSIILYGAGTDSDGSVASYTWTKTSGPSATMSNSNTVNLSVSNMVAGTYVFRLTVKDNGGAIGYDEAVVTVNSSSGVGTSCSTFNESNGLVVMEVESAAIAGDWSKRTAVSGYTGSGYYEWRHGNTATSAIAAGTGVLTYTVQINNAGRYRLQIRSSAPARTDHNDVWVRFPEGRGIAVKGTASFSLGANWFKVYQNVSNNNWTWDSKTKDHDPYDIYVDFPAAGTYRVQLSGRSTQFKVDRLVLYRSTVSSSTALNISNPQSACASSTLTAVDTEDSNPLINFENGTDMNTYPNPTVGNMFFEFSTVKTGEASLELYDIKGTLVKSIFKGEIKAGQIYKAEFDASVLPEGVYMGRLIAPDKVITKKIILKK